MDFIHSKNIFLLTRDTLKLMDSRPMKHGSRVAYLLYKMLQTQGGYEDFEMAEFCMLATLHDIGAYPIADLSKPLTFETRTTLPHSIYGYLFLKYLSPFADRAKILLNHHVTFMELAERGEKEYAEVTNFLSLAECVDVYRESLGERFNVQSFRPFEGKRFSKQALDVLDKAMVREPILEKLDSEEHEQELSKLMDNLMFTNEEKKSLMETIMYCLDFRSYMKVQDTAVCISICSQLADLLHLDGRTQEVLYYGALVHDIGMLGIPKEIIESSRKLTDEEMELMRGHVELEQKILENRLDPVSTQIALRHHERCNGSGYPLGLTGGEMNTPQKILQLADAVTGMINDRPHRPGMPPEKVRQILEKEQAEKAYDPEVIKAFFSQFDLILLQAMTQGKESLRTNASVISRYQKLEKMMQEQKKK
ncbi:MAG: HD domain-containing protein [Lachnospiraceae bacterium]|nr:HD domain-containing protein [Lachnospiraceae bacterium]